MSARTDTIKNLNEKIQRAWEVGNQLLERGTHPPAGLNAEETAALNETTNEVSRLTKTRDNLIASSERSDNLSGLTEELRRISGPMREAERHHEALRLSDFFRPNGAVRTFELDLSGAARAYRAYQAGARGNELRVIAGDTGASGGSLTMPTDVAATVYSFMSNTVGIRRIPQTTILTTAGGAKLRMPRVATQGIATQVANQNTALAGSDPALSSVTFDAFDAAQLVAVGADLVEDSGQIMVDFVAANVGRALGKLTGQWYATGTGSGQPQGVMTAGATGASGTIATGGSLILGTAGAVGDKLTDFVYSVDPDYRMMGAAWLMHDTTLTAIRKIRSGSGGTLDNYLFVPSPTAGLPGGMPDSLLGFPVFFDSNVASMGSDASVAAFGWWGGYAIRDVAGLQLSRSDENRFDANEILFRGILRTDGDLLDSKALNVLHMAVS